MLHKSAVCQPYKMYFVNKLNVFCSENGGGSQDGAENR